MTAPQKTRRYLYIAAGFALALLLLELAFNCLVDPLFYFGGNRITGKGYYMNERISVIVRNRDQLASIDCLVFGSSRSTFLDASKMTGYHCESMAFSGGMVDEFIAYANYLKARGVAPKLIVVGVDNYGSPLSANAIPDFINKDEAPPGWAASYFSLDSLRYSASALWGSESPNYYNHHYRKYIGYPLRRPGENHEDDNFYVLPGMETAVADRMAYYRQLCAIFPKARCIGFVPPVSTWGLEKALKAGITPYLKSMEKLAAVFDGFYDFSILANPKWDFTDTSDGIHYSARVDDHIARKITNPKAETWGFDVKGLTPAAYEQLYIKTARKAVADRKRLDGLP